MSRWYSDYQVGCNNKRLDKESLTNTGRVNGENADIAPKIGNRTEIKQK